MLFCNVLWSPQVFYLQSSGQYLTVSKGGTVGLRDGEDMSLLHTHRLQNSTVTPKDLWVTDMVLLHNVHKVTFTFISPMTNYWLGKLLTGVLLVSQLKQLNKCYCRNKFMNELFICRLSFVGQILCCSEVNKHFTQSINYWSVLLVNGIADMMLLNNVQKINICFSVIRPSIIDKYFQLSTDLWVTDIILLYNTHQDFLIMHSRSVMLISVYLSMLMIWYNRREILRQSLYFNCVLTLL